MTNEEKYLREHLDAKDNPFRVPEGYFDNFTSQLMTKLPEKPLVEQQPSRRRPVLRLWLSVAAGLVVAALSTTIYLSHVGEEAEQPAPEVASSSNYVDDAMDYAMMDNQDIYACLIDE